jgi:MEDS: MEthanogen/methylotroph, DcmR Sensory domain
MRVATPISFAGSQLSESRHVCAFFNTDDEQYRVLLPFIKDGFECGDKAVHVVAPNVFLRELRERRAGRSTAAPAAR